MRTLRRFARFAGMGRVRSGSVLRVPTGFERLYVRKADNSGFEPFQVRKPDNSGWGDFQVRTNG